MNRTTELFDDRIADWLEDDPMVAPGQVLDTIVAALPSIPQRRTGGPFAGALARPALRLAPAVGILAVAAIVLLGLAVALIGPPPKPSPTPLATPMPLVHFESPLYGYSISYPEGWSTRPASERIVGINPPWVDTGVADEFRGQFGGSNPNAIIVVAVAQIAEGTTLATWTERTATAVCGTPTQPQETIQVAGLTATVSTFARCNSYFHIWVTFVRGNQGFHVVWLNFSGTEAADRELFDRILTTFRLPESEPTATPAPAPAVAPVPDVLIGAWYHTAPAWWWFLRAGDPECTEAAATQLDCVYFRRGTLQPEIGTATIVGGDLHVEWRTGFCAGIQSDYGLGLVGDTLNLIERPGGCQGGDLALTRAGTGTAPTAQPRPTP